MKNRIITLVLALSMAMSMLLPISTLAIGNASGDDIYIYVATYGNDKNNGSINSPLKTFERAKEVARGVAGAKPVHIVFREGTYNLDKGVIFDHRDSGNKNAFVTYEAYEGEKVKISATTKIDVSKMQLVEDKETLMRLPVEARGKVLCYDLQKYNGVESLTSADKMCEKSLDTMGMLICNNEIQMLAQWPNGDGAYSYVGKVYAKGSTSSFKKQLNGAGCFGYTIEQPDRWVNSEDAYFLIFPNNDYQAEHLSLVKVDDVDKKIYTGGGGQGFEAARPRKRFKIMNLIEELDVPTEWYVDRNSMMLYYYPMNDFNDNTVLEFTSSEDNMFTFNGASYIAFKNMQVGECYNKAFVMDMYSHDIDIVGCDIRNVGSYAVYSESSERTVFYRVNNWLTFTKGVENLNILNNTFVGIGASAIKINTQGNDETKPSNINIKNNYFTQINNVKPGRYVIEPVGGGITISNNLIHTTNSGGISASVHESDITYNEIYDVCRQLSDCGGIYMNWGYSRIGNDIGYNMIYNIDGRFDYTYGEGYSGVYHDYACSGSYVHHNLMDNIVKTMQYNGGKNLTFEYNISNPNKFTMTYYVCDLTAENWGLKEGSTERNMGDAFIYSKEIPELIKQYPEFIEMIGSGENIITDLRAPHNVAIKNNISTETFVPSSRTKEFERIKEVGEVENNLVIDNLDDFVDAEHMDYRLKTDSPLLKQFPDALTEENFDLSSIGINWNPDSRLIKNFRKYFPQQNATDIDNSDCTFFWSQADGADKYRIVVATDELFEDVVIDEVVWYNNYSTGELNSGETKYYWKVYAINERRYNETNWLCSDGVSSFTTCLVDGNDIESLINAIDKAKEKSSMIVEGENYLEGTKQIVQNAINKAEKFVAEKSSSASKSAVKSAIYELNYELEMCADRVMLNFVDGSELFKSADDYARVGGNGEIKTEDSVFHFENTGLTGILGANNSNLLERDNIFCFKAKFKYGKSWGGFAFRQQALDGMVYSGGQYLIIVKHDRIELQNSAGQGYLAVATNKGIIEEDKWHNIAFGAVNTMNGTRVVFIVDGKTIFDIVDVDSAIEDTGYFGMCAGATGYAIDFTNPDEVYTFVPPVEAENVNISNLNMTNQGNNIIVNGLEGNEIINANITFDASGEGIAFTIKNKMPSANLTENDNYFVQVKDSVINLNKIKNGEKTILAQCDNVMEKGIKSHDIHFAALKSGNNTRIVFVADSQTLIDYYDADSIGSGDCLGIIPLNSKTVTVTVGKGSKYNFDVNKKSSKESITEQSKRNGDINTAEHKLWTLKSEYAFSSFYFYKEIDNNGDKNAKIKVTLDKDSLVQDDDIVEEYTIDFTRGESGWQHVATGTYQSVIIEIVSSGTGTLSTGELAGLQVSTSGDAYIAELYKKFKGLAILKADSNLVLCEDNGFALSNKVEEKKGEFYIPVNVVSLFGAEVKTEADKTIITYNSNVAEFTKDFAKYIVNGQEYEQKLPVYSAQNGELIVSSEALGKILGKDVYRNIYGIVLLGDEIPKNYKIPVTEVDDVIKNFY